MLGLSQVGYVDKVLEWFSMQNSKKGLLPFRHRVLLSDDQRPKTQEEVNMMRQVPYASAVGSLMYAMLCTRPDICYLVGMVSRYQSNPGPKHWQAVKHILKYLRRTRNYMLVYHYEVLIPIGYTDSDFQLDLDFRKSTPGCVFTLGGGAITWRSVKQSCIADSTMEAKYVATCEAAKEAVWLKKFLSDLSVVENVCGAFIVNQDPVCVIASYLDANDERVIIQVVKTLSIFFRETNNGVVDSWHLWDDTC
ncbi:secreted RxLR effector protein 161-like [Quercus suber]|uniref:secreted RxLR effector protein 161-like n=1 Tax=Quercus suber TaxID=58331 RepID=UPI0032DEFE58